MRMRRKKITREPCGNCILHTHQLYTNKNNNPLLFYCVRGLSGRYPEHIAVRRLASYNENRAVAMAKSLGGKKNRERRKEAESRIHGERTRRRPANTDRKKRWACVRCMIYWLSWTYLRMWAFPFGPGCVCAFVVIVRNLSHHVWILHANLFFFRHLTSYLLKMSMCGQFLSISHSLQIGVFFPVWLFRPILNAIWYIDPECTLCRIRNWWLCTQFQCGFDYFQSEKLHVKRAYYFIFTLAVVSK